MYHRTWSRLLRDGWRSDSKGSEELTHTKCFCRLRMNPESITIFWGVALASFHPRCTRSDVNMLHNAGGVLTEQWMRVQILANDDNLRTWCQVIWCVDIECLILMGPVLEYSSCQNSTTRAAMPVGCINHINNGASSLLTGNNKTYDIAVSE